ncbi:MAG: tetratricopeptide repeat protein [Acidobacteriota bacterium]
MFRLHFNLLSWLIFLSLSAALHGRPHAQDPCQDGARALAEKNMAEAEVSLKQCLSLRPDWLTPYLQLAALYQQQQKDEALIEIAEKGLERFPEEPRFYLTVGNHAGRKGNLDHAVTTFSEGLKRWPENTSLRNGLLQAFLARGLARLDRNQNEEAEADLRQALKLDERNAEGLLNLGRALHNLNRSVEAGEVLDRLLEIDPSTPLVQFHRGMVLHGLGEFDAAMEALTQEIRSNPAYPPSYYLRGLCLQFKARWREAAADLALAVEKMPEHTLAVYELGRSLTHLGETQKAEQAFRKALQLDPSNAKALYSLGRLLAAGGRQQEAQRMFERAARANSAEREADGAIRFQSEHSRDPR